MADAVKRTRTKQQWMLQEEIEDGSWKDVLTVKSTEVSAASREVLAAVEKEPKLITAGKPLRLVAVKRVFKLAEQTTFKLTSGKK